MKSLDMVKKPSSDEPQSKDFFKIYPNPAISYFVIEFNQDMVTKAETLLIIDDELGRPIQEYIINSKSDHKVISTSNLGKGVFLCKFVVGYKIVQTERLIIL